MRGAATIRMCPAMAPATTAIGTFTARTSALATAMAGVSAMRAAGTVIGDTACATTGRATAAGIACITAVIPCACGARRRPTRCTSEEQNETAARRANGPPRRLRRTGADPRGRNIECDRRCVRNIEALDGARQLEPGNDVACRTRQLAQALALGTQHERQRRLQLDGTEIDVSLAGKADDKESRSFEHLEPAREIGDRDKRHRLQPAGG